MVITSSSNPKIQLVRNLINRRKDRDETGQFVIEGVRLVEEAVTAGYKANLILYSTNLSERGQMLLSHPGLISGIIEEVSPAIMQSISGTEAPQGLLAVLPMISQSLPDNLDFLVIADGIRDPGNLGAIIRSAAAAGSQAVILSPTTTDGYSPKVLRAGMGGHFSMVILSLTWDEIKHILKQKPIPLRIFLAASGRGTLLWQADLKQPLAVLIGGEAEGVSSQGINLADELITIPMPGGNESLNAAVAASILLFEVVRQRHS